MAAAHALANLVPEDKLSEEYVIPGPFEEGVADAVAEQVAKIAVEMGVVRED